MIEEIEIDEDIDKYQNCLDDDDKEWTVQEECNMRDCYGIKCMPDDTLQAIQNGRMKSDKMHLQGIHTYDILRNPHYVKDFQYYAAMDLQREAAIVDDDNTRDNDASQSDLVRICLNLAFIDKKKLREDWGPEGLTKNGLADKKKQLVKELVTEVLDKGINKMMHESSPSPSQSPAPLPQYGGQNAQQQQPATGLFSVPAPQPGQINYQFSDPTAPQAPVPGQYNAYNAQQPQPGMYNVQQPPVGQFNAQQPPVGQYNAYQQPQVPGQYNAYNAQQPQPGQYNQQFNQFSINPNNQM